MLKITALFLRDGFPYHLSSVQDSQSGCCYRINDTIPSFSKLNFLSSLILLWVLLLCEQCFLFSALFCYLASMFTKLPFFLPWCTLTFSFSIFFPQNIYIVFSSFAAISTICKIYISWLTLRSPFLFSLLVTGGSLQQHHAGPTSVREGQLHHIKWFQIFLSAYFPRPAKARTPHS